jgi:hypothetical protein
VFAPGISCGAVQHSSDTAIKQEHQGKGKTLAFFYYIYTKTRLCYHDIQAALVTLRRTD